LKRIKYNTQLTNKITVRYRQRKSIYYDQITLVIPSNRKSVEEVEQYFLEVLKNKYQIEVETLYIYKPTKLVANN